MSSTPRSLPLVALALGVAILVVQIRVIAGGQTWDDVRYHTDVAPPRLAAAAQVGRGALPAWWDGSGLGVPLAGEPSHGALYPPVWLAVSPHALDLVMIAHLAWAALGVAVWTRRRASDRSALVAGVLIATTGILASAALRGALPALAHLPWLGVAVEALVAAGDARADDRAARAAAAIAILLGAIALVGELAVVGDALVLAVVLGARRTTWRWLAAAIAAGLAIGAAQWLPAIWQLPASTGGEAFGLPLARLLELVVPSASGSGTGAVAALAGEAAWAPSVFVGAPLLALAAVRAPSRRALGVIAAFALAALIPGRGGWPAWTGAPELHLAALAIVLAAFAGDGLDSVIAGQRRGVLALVVGAGLTALALAAFAALRAQHAELAPAIDRALINGALGVVCMAGAAALAWRASGKHVVVLCALLVAPSVSGARAITPTTDRGVVGEPPMWAALSAPMPPPVRAFRPAIMVDQAGVSDAIATFAGGSAWRWGLAAARSDDPARPKLHDATWLAAAHEGGALLDRFGIGLAILPSTLVGPRQLTALGRRGGWALVSLPVAPVAAVMRGWQWSVDPDNALNLLFPTAGGTGVPRGTTVLAGRGPSGPTAYAPLACAIRAWRAGDIELACTSDADGYATVSSTAAAGWTVTVDDQPADWLTADVLRRAVRVAAGRHRVHWTYAAPGLALGGGIALAGALAALAFFALGRRRAPRELLN